MNHTKGDTRIIVRLRGFNGRFECHNQMQIFKSLSKQLLSHRYNQKSIFPSFKREFLIFEAFTPFIHAIFRKKKSVPKKWFFTSIDTLPAFL